MKKQLISLILTLSTLTACGMEEPPSGLYNVDPEFEPYVNYLADVALDYGARIDIENLSVELRDLGSADGWTTLGSCYNMYEINPILVFDRRIWAKANETERRMLVLHEAGHCVLKRMHTSDRHSLMHFTIKVSPSEFEANPWPYLDELFTNPH
ncbi:MAG: hypothetical protein ACOH5I_21825 [Oligoflexus sp.]